MKNIKPINFLVFLISFIGIFFKNNYSIIKNSKIPCDNLKVLPSKENPIYIERFSENHYRFCRFLY